MKRVYPLLFLIVFVITSGTLLLLNKLVWIKNPLDKLFVIELGLLSIFFIPFFLIQPLAKLLKGNIGFSFLIISMTQFILGGTWLIILMKTNYIFFYKGTTLIFTGSYLSYLAVEVFLVLVLNKYAMDAMKEERNK